MKRMISNLLVVAAFMLPVSVMAEVKVVVVDPIKAIGQTTEVKNRTAAMEVQVKEQESRLKKLRDEILAIESQMKKEELTLSNEKKLELKQSAEAKMFEFQSLQQSVQTSLQEDQQSLMEIMSPRFDLAVGTIAADKGYDLVLNRQAVLFMDDKLDITQAVTQKMNELNK